MQLGKKDGNKTDLSVQDRRADNEIRVSTERANVSSISLLQTRHEFMQCNSRLK